MSTLIDIAPPQRALPQVVFLQALLVALRIVHGPAIRTGRNEHRYRFDAVARIVNTWPEGWFCFIPNMMGQYLEWEGALLNALYVDRLLHYRTGASDRLIWNFDKAFAERLLDGVYPECREAVLALAQVYDEALIQFNNP
jgi:hypothetical protein